MSTITETLTVAKHVLIERGRGQVDLINDSTGCVCALGAIGIAVDEFELRTKGYSMFTEGPAAKAAMAVAEIVPEYFRVEDRRDYAEVYRFNDAQETSDQDVLDAFDKAIAIAQGE